MVSASFCLALNGETNDTIVAIKVKNIFLLTPSYYLNEKTYDSMFGSAIAASLPINPIQLHLGLCPHRPLRLESMLTKKAAKDSSAAFD
jgi:hypothetical protein